MVDLKETQLSSVDFFLTCLASAFKFAMTGGRARHETRIGIFTDWSASNIVNRHDLNKHRLICGDVVIFTQTEIFHRFRPFNASLTVNKMLNFFDCEESLPA
jgi:hypothetical protein